MDIQSNKLFWIALIEYGFIERINDCNSYCIKE